MKKEETELTVEELKAKIDENLNLAKYHKAELENFKRRNANAVSSSFKDGQSYVINMILPVYDGVVEAGKKIADKADLAGFEIIRKKLDEAFSKLGIEEVPTVDKEFDPKIHNAAAVEKVEGVEPNIVIEEWQKGFTLNGLVLRPAMVKISG